MPLVTEAQVLWSRYPTEVQQVIASLPQIDQQNVRNALGV
jgi:hypothetical protein